MTANPGPFEQDLDKNPANYAPLTPLSFIERAAYVYPKHTSVIHGAKRYTWQETYARCRRLGSALVKRGIGIGDTVAAMLANTPEMYEAHFGVPMCGAVLNTLNTRLDAEAIAFMLEHGEAKVLLTDREFSPIVEKALALAKAKPVVIDVDDSEYSGPGKRLGVKTYEELLAEGDPEWNWLWPADEWQAISLNYTSGTTGNPKGVVYHHRGAYLNGVGNILVGMPHHAVYLWTLPMFHCNGWCSVDHGGQRRHQRLPAQGGCRTDIQADHGASRHALLRRADRAPDADQRSGGAEEGHHAQGELPGRRRGAARCDHRRHGEMGFQSPTSTA